jgi:hypothetical protein
MTRQWDFMLCVCISVCMCESVCVPKLNQVHRWPWQDFVCWPANVSNIYFILAIG